MIVSAGNSLVRVKSALLNARINTTYPENDITGDVLLELDVNTLKEEIGIPAFGKRMRIANSIAELRRPPSVNSSSPSVRTPNHQHTVFSSGYGGSSRGTGSAPQSMTLYSPESAPH